MKKLFLSGLLCCLLLAADFSPPSWRYRRLLALTAPAPIAEFSVDAALYRDSAANLDDLRILRDDAETPYVILTLAGVRQIIAPPVAMVNKAWAPGVGVQAVLDLKRRVEHNRLLISTPLHNYKENVKVETSDDAHNWAVVQSAGLIFDVARPDRTVSETTVTYPMSTRRYIRLTVPGWTDPANLTSVSVAAFQETGATRNQIAALSPAVHENPVAQTTDLTLDLGFAGQPYDRIDFAVDPGLFSRSVEITNSNDLQHWYSTAGGAIFRTADEEQLSVEITERTERYLKVTVFNGDSAPLPFGKITLSGIRRVVRFSTARTGTYRVYIGNPSARQPSYDFARVIPASTVPAAAQLGPVETNPAFRMPERPWTDRNPWLLNGTLAAAVVAMALVTLRMLRKMA